MNYRLALISLCFLAGMVALSGCAGVSGYVSYDTGYYHGFYDPYPCWGCVDHHPPPPDRPGKPGKPGKPGSPGKPVAPKPPVIKPPISGPPGGIGRPRPGGGGGRRR